MNNVFTSLSYRTVAQHTASAPLYIRFLSLFLFLIIGIGNAWADTTYTLINQSTGAINNTDFFTGVASTTNDATGKTIADLSSMNYYVKFGGTASPGTYYTNRYIQYDAKTTETTIYIYVYNGGSKVAPCRVQEIKEGNTSFETLHEKSIAKSTSDTIQHVLSNTGNSTVYITVGGSDVYAYQVIAIESGTPLKKGGEAGYALNLNKGRVALASGSNGMIDGIELISAGGNYTAASSTVYKIPTASEATKHIKFTTPASPVNVKVTFSKGQMAYNTSASATGATNITSGTAYSLSASTTYYLINTGAAEAQLTKLEFEEPKMIYLKNSMGWSNAYVTLLGTSSYWDGTNGSGSYGKTTYTMSYDSSKKLFYVEVPAASTDTYLAFTKDKQENYGNFYETEAVYVNGGYSFGKVVYINTSTTFYKNSTKYYGNTDHTGVQKDVDYSADVYLIGTHNSWAKNDDAKFTSGTPYTKTVTLAAGTKYEFKVLDNAYFGLDTKWILDDKSGLTFSQVGGDVSLVASITGDYTFTYNRTSHAVTVTYPTHTHPCTGYVYITKWWDHCYAHYWYTSGSDVPLTEWGSDPEIETYTSICGTAYYYAPVITGYPKIILKDAAGDPSNTTGDQVTTDHEGQYITHSGSWGWHAYATYTITYAKGDGSGTMSASTGICPGADQDLPACSFTAPTGYEFSHWTADVNVTVSSETVEAGDPIDDEATIEDIEGNITLTAQWSAKTYSITLDNESATSEGSTSVTLTYNSNSHAAITNPTKTGYDFSGWYSGDDGTGSLIINTSGVLQANVDGYTGAGGIWTKDATTTLHAKWTAKTTTLTFDKNGGSAAGSATATYGSSNLTSVTHATPVTDYEVSGYYTTATDSPVEGVKIINADGSLVKNTTYTTNDATPTWKSELSSLTLYARYQAIVYDYTFAPTKTSGSIADGDTVVTSTGGTMVFTPHGSSTTLKYETDGVKFEGGGSGGVTVTLDKMIQVGTKIAITFYCGSAGARGIKLADADSAHIQTYTKTAIGTYTEIYTVTAKDGYDGTHVFRVLRNNHAHLKSLKVYNCGGYARTVTYYDRGSSSGSVPAAAKVYEDGTNVTVKDNIGLLQHSGDSVFAGWATSTSKADAGTVDYLPGSVISSISADVDLYPVWKDGCYLISLTGSSEYGTKDATDFYAPQALQEPKSAVTVKGVCFSKSYYKLSGQANGTAPNYLAMTGCNRFVYYDTKTDNTSLTVYLSSASSSAQSFYYQVLKEGDMQALQTVALPANGDTVVTINVAHSKGSRVVFGVSNVSLYITQIKAVEDGDPIVAVGEDGFEMAIPGRPVANLTATSGDYKGSVDGVVFHSTYRNPKLYTGTNELILIGTSGETCADYIEFTTTAPTQLLVTCRNANAYQYYIKTSKTFDSSSDTKYGVKGGVSKVNLTSAGTWYILSDTVQITKIAFAAAPEITYHANGGTGTMDNTIATIATNTFTREGFTFVGWNTADDGTGDPYTAGTEVYESLDLYAQWAHTITYHSAMDDDYVVEGIADEDDVENEYVATDCATDRVFVGWASSEVSTQQSEPDIVSTDGTLTNVTTNMDLYAVYASRNGSDGHDYVDNFNSYTTTSTYNSATPKIYGIWSVTYGTASALTDVTTKMGSNAILLQKETSGAGTMVTSKKIHNFTGLTCKIATTHNSVNFVIEYSTNGSSWTILEGPTNHGAVRAAITYTRTKAGDPVDAYVRFKISSAGGTGADYRMYIDDVTLYSKPHEWIYTDYTTACTKPATVAVTFDKDGGTGDVPTAPATGGSITLPALTKAGYMLDGYTVQADGQDEADGIYYVGESFLVNHSVTFDAQWTKYFESIDNVSPITSGKDIAVRSVVGDSIVINSDDCSTPTASITGTDKDLFAVTIDDTHKRRAGGKTHYPFYVTYTPAAHNAIHEAEITFTCDGIESSAITVRGRSLPDEFVIAGKYSDDGKWYALPNNIATSSGTVPVPIEVYVDNNSTPTKALVAKENLVYKTANRYEPNPNTQFVSLRLTPDGTKYLRAGIGDNSMWLTTENSVYTNWYLSSSDLASYLVTQDPANLIDKRIGFWTYSGAKMGFHSNPPKGSTIYLLPIETKADYKDATVTSWAQYHIEVTLAAELDVDAVTAKLGATSDDATALTGSGTQYGITFDDLDLSNKSCEKLVLVWKNSGSTVGASIVTIPSIVAPSAEVSDWSDISATEDDIVVIKSDVTVDATDAVAKAVVLTDDHKLTIGANKALVVSGKITREDGSPTTAADLVIKSTSSGNGTLIFENDGNEATVEMYSIASTAGAKWTWQYIASPVSDASVLTNYYDGYLYKWAWDETNSKYAWISQGVSATTETFAGYCLSYPTAGHTFVIEGALATETSKDISVPAGKEMVVGNSWTAPIQIKQLRDADFSNLSKNVYLFNTGNDEGCSGTSGTRSEAGTYVTIPIHSSPYTGDSVISALQAFFVTNNTASEGSLHLSYADHVRPASGNSVVNGPMFAPQRTKAEQHPVVLKLWACGSRYEDKFVLLEHSDFSKDLDEGWDGEKWFGGEASPAIYTTRPDGTPDAVSALPELDGTVINFRAGEDNTYTLRFEYAEDNDELYIVDTQTAPMQTTRVLSGNTYTFNTSNNDTPARFLLTRSNAPQITTGNANANANAEKATKLILNQQLYIYRNGILYDATGRRVDSFSVGSGFDANANANAEQEKGGAE